MIGIVILFAVSAPVLRDPLCQWGDASARALKWLDTARITNNEHEQAKDALKGRLLYVVALASIAMLVPVYPIYMGQPRPKPKTYFCPITIDYICEWYQSIKQAFYYEFGKEFKKYAVKHLGNQ